MNELTELFKNIIESNMVIFKLGLFIRRVFKSLFMFVHLVNNLTEFVYDVLGSLAVLMTPCNHFSCAIAKCNYQGKVTSQLQHLYLWIAKMYYRSTSI